MPANIHFINTHSDYLHTLNAIKESDIFFLDTEFIREKTYRPIVALIQIAIDDNNAYLIDPTFDGFEARLLFDILNDPNKKIVFHSARQDLEIFYYHYGFTAHNLMDTQIIAAALGYGDQISFENLVKTITSEAIDKSQQRTDWLKRPLSSNQLKYAACDVLYLARIYPVLYDALKSQGRLAWIQDDIDYLCNSDIFQISPESLFKKVKHGLTQPKAIHVLQSLAILRENIAINKDVIRNYICPDSILAELAEKRPKTLDDLQKNRNLKHNFVHTYFNLIIETITEAEKSFDTQTPMPKPERLTHSQEKLINILSVAADAIASNYSIARRLFATHNDIVTFVRTSDAPFLHGWRYEVFGKPVQDILEGYKGLYFNQGQIVIK